MKRVIDTSEVLGTLSPPEGEFEVCAAADANYDEEAQQLIVHLNSFVRTTNIRVKEEQLSRSWLPRPETIRESVHADEALALARDIFHRWVRKVRQSAPSLHGANA